VTHHLASPYGRFSWPFKPSRSWFYKVIPKLVIPSLQHFLLLSMFARKIQPNINGFGQWSQALYNFDGDRAWLVDGIPSASIACSQTYLSFGRVLHTYTCIASKRHAFSVHYCATFAVMRYVRLPPWRCQNLLAWSLNIGTCATHEPLEKRVNLVLRKVALREINSFFELNRIWYHDSRK
jgi:hypothetical protein